MASRIQELLHEIEIAIYGEQVRSSIHDAIEECYTDVSTATTAATAATSSANQAATRANTQADLAETAVSKANAAASSANTAAIMMLAVPVTEASSSSM